MPVFFFFNQDVANLFAGGNNGPPLIRYRDLGVFFPALLLMGSLSGAPQLVLPLGLYVLLGPQVNMVENVLGSSFAKLGAFLLVTILMFWDFLPFFFADQQTVDEEIESTSHLSYSFDEPRDEGVMLSALSEMSLVLLISITLALLSHWEEIHSYIVRSLPRPWSRRFRELTRSLGIHPTSTNPGLSPATPDAISSLETVEFTARAEGDCSICLEAFKTGDVAKKLPCNHLFHTPCVMPWLNQRSSCPVCRSSVERSEDERSNDVTESPRRSSHHGRSQEGVRGGIGAVWDAFRSVTDPTAVFNHSLRVEDRDALMQLTTRELRERARARNISLQGIVEKREIVDLLLGNNRG